MSENTNIQWCHSTWSPWLGCSKVSPGCLNCYIVDTTPFRVRHLKHGEPRQRTSASYWRQPISWNKKAEKSGERLRIFPSLCDWLDDEVPIEWLADLLTLIHDTPNLDWLLLTKRPENWYRRVSLVDSEMAESWVDCVDMPERGVIPDNVWIGTTIENQEMADKRIHELLRIPAKVRFLSVEPILEWIDLLKHADFNGVDLTMSAIHWAIFGGESGTHARPCNVAWIRDGIQQCEAVRIAPFVKQLGSHAVIKNDSPDEGWPGHTIPIDDRYEPAHQGELAPLRFADKKGGNPDEWPTDLRIRQFPELH